jgi:hypothetical protein
MGQNQQSSKNAWKTSEQILMVQNHPSPPEPQMLAESSHTQGFAVNKL